MEFDLAYVFEILFRWLHVLSAVLLVGGMMFMLWALLPAAATLGEEQQKGLMEAVRSRWATPVWIAVALLLVSGVINIMFIEQKYLVGKTDYYRLLFGIKFVLAFVVFFLASALTGRGKATERFRQQRRIWLGVTLAVAIIIICISGILRKAELTRKPLAQAAPSPAAGAPAAGHECLCQTAKRELV